MMSSPELTLRRQRVAPIMGTWASVHVHDAADPGMVDDAMDSVIAELERLEAVFSTFRSDSEISRMNRRELALTDASPEVIEVMDHCSWLERASGGAFDIRPDGLVGRLDPAGFVKGWATERAATLLTKAGLRHWYVSVGGDTVVSGRPSPDRPWRVGIADPFDDGKVKATLDVESGAVATSGTSARGLHLWDRRTGLPARAFASVTVTGPSLAWADAFATTVFVMGGPGLAWVRRFRGYEAVAVELDGTLSATPGFDRRR